MMNVSAIVSRSARFLPERTALIEAAGFFLFGLGLFLGLACFTYDPTDYLLNDYDPHKVTNMAGPFGAWLAHQVLSSLGIVGMALPMAFVLWGVLIILGFALAPKPRRVVGFVLLMMVLSALAQIQLSAMRLNEPSFGYGGYIGQAIGGVLWNSFGYGGSIIASIILGFLSLVLTQNLAFSRTRSNLHYIVHHLKTGLSKFVELFKDEELKTEEELIKEALKEELRQSGRLASKLSTSAGSTKSAGVVSGRKKRLKKSSSPEDLDLEKLAEEAVLDIESGDHDTNADDSEPHKIDFYYRGTSHGKPAATIFTRSSKAKNREGEFKKMAEKLTAQLKQFKVEGKVTRIIEGPVVTTYEFEPVPGTKISKVEGLAKDLARMLQATSLRILAPIPGKQVLGFEVPNKERRIIGFSDMAGHRNLKMQKVQLPIAMGLDAFGKVAIEDLAKMPHLLVAGSTGSGKSVFMNTLIGSLISRYTAKDLRFIMVDPKMVELAAYNDLPHMACPVITDPAGEAKEKLDALVSEMEERFDRMRKLGARNITSYNEIIKTKRKSDFPKFDGLWQPMPYIVLIIDELADMMMVLGKDAEIPITRLAQKARAAGIHLVIATQRPSAEVVTGLIKANFPTRVAFRVLSGTDSRTILDTSGAEALLGQGDMLFLDAKGLRRMHGAFLSDEEVQKMVKACRK